MKIAIIGYGKMGHMIEEVALSRGHEITCVIEKAPSNSPIEGERKIWSPEEGFQSEAFKRADVAIEFTTPATAMENIQKAWAQGVPVVCGSTGWIQNLSQALSSWEGAWKIEQASNRVIVKDERGKVMLVWSSNYSVGVNIFFDINQLLAEKMSDQPQYTPSITETHHIHKLDKPSGTAKTLAEQIGRELSITSIREGEVPGTHEVKWDSEEDTIIITHIAKGRRGFALGAVLAAEKI
jgi:4-hydroxy-tetrahydrodipicolinate reductase